MLHEEIPVDPHVSEELGDNTADNYAGSPTIEDIPALFQDLQLDDLDKDEELQDPGCLDDIKDRRVDGTISDIFEDDLTEYA